VGGAVHLCSWRGRTPASAAGTIHNYPSSLPSPHGPLLKRSRSAHDSHYLRLPTRILNTTTPPVSLQTTSSTQDSHQHPPLSPALPRQRPLLELAAANIQPQHHPLPSAMASWNNDYCLSCDRQMSEPSAYCSQACRLADLEKAGRTQTSPQHLSSSASSTTSSSNGFYLPPPVNFSAYKAPSRSKGFDVAPASPYHYYPTANGSYFAPPSTTRPTPQRSLTPSSSRSSLASTSSQSQSGVSQQAASQLNNYMRSFDQTRDLKRRFNQY
jgi:hypothetical protein